MTMAYMQWTQDLDTRIQVIDDQHRRIVDYINELHRASQDESTEDVRRVLDALVDYTVTHFEFEEELMKRANYPFIKAHKRVHEIFQKRVDKFLQRANAGEAITQELLAMLKIWLSSHIKGDDRDYVDAVMQITATHDRENAGWLSSTLQRLFGSQPPVSASTTLRT
jgi:hemerythrin